jgi:ABC-type transport system involved in Fe-S cluster assembly fused permease/ATPase subunit
MAEKIERNSVKIQKLLSSVNIGQSFILEIGILINLSMAALDVVNGKMSAGSFLAI